MAKVVSLSTLQTTTRHQPQHEPASSARTESLFVGREREMTALQASLADALAGHGRLVLLMGEAGIGKTRTTQQVASAAHRHGARVFIGRCHEAEGAPPFWPWVQIVRAYLRECSLATLHADLGAGASDIAQIITEVRERLPTLPPAPSLEPEQARFRFFDSFTSFLKQVAQAQPLVLMLDDLHWADASSLLLLQFVVRECGDAPVLLLGTYRDMDLDLQHPLRRTLSELTRAVGSQTVHLRGLAQSEVAQVLQNLTGASPADTLVTAVHQQTEGNPFFLTEVARALASEGQPDAASVPSSGTPLPVPQRVLDVLSRRLIRLSEDCRRVLALAAVIGRDFTLTVVTRASELSPPQILQALEEAIAAQVVTADPQTLSSYSFSHALMRETVYRELTLTQRMTLHHQVGAAVESLRDADLTPHLTELAYHFGMAAQGGMAVEKALTYATRAGEHATRSLAYEEAIPQYQRALDFLMLHAPDERNRCELLLALGDAHRRAGQSTLAKAAFLEAATSARQQHHARHLARAALGFAGIWVSVDLADKTVIALLEEALRALGEEEDLLRARLYARLATEFWFAPSREQRVTFSQQAVTLARRTADQRTLGYCLQAQHLTLGGAPQLAERLAITAEMVRLAHQAGDLELTLQAYSRRVVDLLEAGDLVALETTIAKQAQVAAQLRQPAYLWFTGLFQAMRGIMVGQFEEGERLAHQALVVGQQAQVSSRDAIVNFGIQLMVLRREQGRLGEMESAVKGLILQYPLITSFQCALAYLYSEADKVAEAREQFEKLARQEFADLPQDPTLPLSLTLLARVCVWLDDTHRAAQLYTLLLPYADYNVVIRTAIAYFEPASHALGLLATSLGKWDEAERHFAAALAMNTQLGARPRLADTQCAYADLLLTRQQAGDQEHAIVLLDSALATARELGMAGLLAKAESQKSKVKSPRSKVLTPQSAIPNPQSVGVFRKAGDYWTIAYQETSFRLHHLRGLDYIAHLLRHPDVEFLALDLLAPTADPVSLSVSTQHRAFGDPSAPTSQLDGGEELLDSQARATYKHRLEELREELEEAQAFNDLGRVDKLQQEMDFLAAELARAVGLGGRARTTATAAERARVNVAKGIRIALAKIAEQSPLLEHYLATSIKTGLFCSYTPSPVNPITWDW